MKVLICDDHGVLRDGLRALLEKHAFEVVGEAETGRAALALAREVRPDVVLMDISMPEMNGVEATHRLVAELPGIRVVGLSIHSDHRYVTALMAAGAVACVSKTAVSQQLIAVLRDVAAGLAPPAVPPIRPGTKTLSPREREVLQLLAEGASSKDIAARLEISVTTVETYRRQIMDKLALRTIAELTKYAIREGLTSID